MFHCLPAEAQAAEIAAAGFSDVELACESVVDPATGQLSRDHAERLRDAYARAGVRMRQVHYPLQTLNPAVRAIADLPASERAANLTHPDERRREWELHCAEELLGLCPLLGIEAMVVHPGGGGWRDEAELAQIEARNLAALRRLAPTAEQHGVTIAVENMARAGDRLSYGADFGQLIALVDAVGSANVGICLDTSHANIVGIDIPAAIRAMGHRLVATHISDNLGTHDNHLFPYGGRIAWPP